MHKQIKELAEEALKLQNKNSMDEALRKIVAICDEPPAQLEHVTYGTAKQFDTEAEMIADIQGRPSPVFPIPGTQSDVQDAAEPMPAPVVSGDKKSGKKGGGK